MTYPTIMPALTLDFQNSQQLDPRVTFSRTQATAQATYINSAGQVVYAAEHEPRFDHDPETGECLGLLIEESKTNYIDESVDLTDTVTWANYKFETPTLNAGTAPDGTNTAASLIPNTENVNRSYWCQNISRTFSGTLTVSVFAKANGYSNFRLGIDSSSTGGAFGGSAVFDLSIGDVTQGTAGTGKIQSLSNGWYRCSVTHTNTAQAFGITPYVGGIDNNGDTVFTGDGTSGYLLWGFQLEESALSSYIPTDGSELERSPDIATISEANFTSLWTPNAGTWIVNGGPSYLVTDNSVLVRVDADSSNYSMTLNAESSENRLQFSVKDTGTTSGEINNTEVGIGSISSLAWDTNSDNTVNIRIDTEGLFEENSTTRTLNASINKLQLGNYRGQFNFLNGHISRFAYYNERLTDAELQTITL